MDTGLSRVSVLEKYYTKQTLADNIIHVLNEKYILDSFSVLIEPSAGSGVFINNKFLPGEKLRAFDIDPVDPRIIKCDFLEQSFEQGNVLVYGNPPFGRQSSLAKKFIKHSANFAKVIAFILPRSFKKESMYKCFPLNFHKVYQMNIPEKSFEKNGCSYDVPCVFQIWERKDFYRQGIIKLKENDNYFFVKKQDTSINTVAFKRVGGNAGKFIFKNAEELSSESHIFFNTRKEMTEETILVLKSVLWETDNTVGPKSISKQELIEKLNCIL